MLRLGLLLLVSGLAYLAGCQSDADVPQLQATPGIEVPTNFPTPVYTFQTKLSSQEGVELGRTLFYDTRLSSNNQVSCGSCHQQSAAFAQADHRVSPGVNGLLGTRNAPALQNLRWKKNFFWDGGPQNLETLPLAPLTNPVEMNETLENVLRKLNAEPEYQRRFNDVYGQTPIDSRQLLLALTQFMATLTSANSRYDQYVRQEPGGQLTEIELRGRAIFAQKCATCHATDLFSDDSFRNNGLDRSFAADPGRAHITSLPADKGRFKVPSLRNVLLTAPYMHDGRFQTLTQVLDHYDHGVVESPTLDPLLRQPSGHLGIPLSTQEKKELLAFLSTLTDEQFLRDRHLAKH